MFWVPDLLAEVKKHGSNSSCFHLAVSGLSCDVFGMIGSKSFGNTASLFRPDLDSSLKPQIDLIKHFFDHF